MDKSELNPQQKIAFLEKELDQIKNVWLNSINSIEDILIIIDKDQIIEDINEAGLRFLNKSKEEVKGRKCFEQLPFCKAFDHACPMCQSLKSGQAETIERYDALDHKYFSIKSSPVFNENGDIIKYIDILRDISDSKRHENDLIQKNKEIAARNAEYESLNEEYSVQNEELQNTVESLNESESLFKTVWESTMDGMVISDEQGIVWQVNQKYLDIFGYSREEVLYHEFAHSEVDPEKLKSEYQRIFQLNNPVDRFEAIFTTKKGEKKNIEIRISFIYSSKKKKLMLSVLRDITQQKEAEKEIQRSTNFIKDLIKSIPGAVFQFSVSSDGKWSFPFLSDTMERIYERPNSGLKTKDDLFSVVHKEDLEALIQSIQLSLDNLSSWTFDYRVSTPSGKLKWIRGISNPRKLSDGSTIWNGIILDIDEQKSAEKALQKSEEKYRLLAETAQDLIFIHDLQGKIEYVNNSASLKLGLSTDALYQKNISDIIAEEYKDELFRRSKKRKDGNSDTFIYESGLMTQKGDILELEVSSIPITIDKNKPSFLIIGRDITERKKAANALRNSEERYRTLAETAQDLIIIHDLDGEIQYVNSAANSILGYEVNQLSAKNILDFVDEEFIPDIQQRQANRLNQFKDRIIYEINVIASDGEKIPFEVNSAPIIRDGKVENILIIARDIRERVQSERALRENEKKLQHIAQNVPGMVFQSRINAQEEFWFTYVSSGCKNLYGYEPEEILQNPNLMWDAVHPGERKLMEKAMKASIQTGNNYQMEHRLISKDGEIKWVKGLAKPEKLNEGIVTFTGVVIDITEQKQIEMSLIESEERFRLVATHTNDIIYEWDLEKDKIKWHGNIQRVVDSNNIPESTSDLVQLMHPEDAELLNSLVREHLEKKTPWSHEYRLMLSDKIKHIHGTGVALYQKGKPYKVYGAITDISRQVRLINRLKEAKQKAEENEELFRSTFEQAAAGIVIIAPDQTFIKINQKFCDMLGYSQEEMMQLTFSDVTHPEDLYKDMEVIEGILKGEISTFVIEKRYLHKNGSIVWIYGHGTIVRDKNHQPKYTVGVVHDITQQKKYEFQLLEREKELSAQNEEYLSTNEELAESNQKIHEINERLAKANQELDSFVYRVSHDLRAPITSSLGLSRLSQNTPSIEDVHQYAKLQEESLQKLDNFIKDILNYSRNSRVEVKSEEIDLESLLDSILEENKYSVDNKIRIIKEIKVDEPFRSDQLRVKIILNNLISNALKFQNKYKEDPYIQMNIKVDINQAIITVTDNGIGIQEEYVDKIFEMFYRATDKGPGSGIGLYILKDCLDKLKGDIAVESEFGEGTTFKVTLPNMQ